MDKVYKVIIAIFLVVFSFFYTEKVIDFIRESDPIMKNIKKSEKDYKVDPINATIKDNKIVPGVNGKTIDYDNSYKKMKKYGTYNESLTVFKEELPTISIDVRLLSVSAFLIFPDTLSKSLFTVVYSTLYLVALLTALHSK